MVRQQTLDSFLTALLQPNLFKDYCPNGLQLSGKQQVTHLVSGVSLCAELIAKAIAIQADAILVHHGLFWNGDSRNITGIQQQRIKQLITNNINLWSYHLPLDYHLEYGNNVQLAKKLDIAVTGSLFKDTPYAVGNIGELLEPMSLDDFAKKIANVLHIKPIVVAKNLEQRVNKVAWCTGAAQKYMARAIDLGVDVYLTGEHSEANYYQAKESKTAFIAAGHYASERYGVIALGDYIAKSFAIKHTFIEIDNPL